MSDHNSQIKKLRAALKIASECFDAVEASGCPVDEWTEAKELIRETLAETKPRTGDGIL